MKTKFSLFTILLLIGILTTAAIRADDQKPSETPKPGAADPNGPRLSGPYTHENLTIFLVHHKEAAAKEQYMTLQEALDKGIVKVKETGSVGQLVIHNNAENINIYIQSGDIVKGGKQDRTIPYDYILPPKVKKLPVNSFCVESGRWRKRGSESADEFGSSAYMLSSPEQRMAAKYEGDQGRVWQRVAEFQNQLSENVGQSVQSSRSASSLQLSLEHEKVREFTAGYIKKLQDLLQDKPDAAGFVYAINGQIVGADVYASTSLFGKLWPKLLQAAVTEAAAKFEKGKELKTPTLQEVEAFLNPAQITRTQKKKIDENNEMIIHETDQQVIFETYEAGESKPIHVNTLRSTPETRNPETQMNWQQQIQQREYRIDQPRERRNDIQTNERR